MWSTSWSVAWLLNFYGFSHTNCMVFYRTPWTRYGIPWNCIGTSGNPMAFHGTPRYSMEFHGIPWNSVELHGIPWNSMDTPWNSMAFHGYSMDTPWEFRGTPWISMDFHGIPWRYLHKCSENSRSQIVFRTDIFRKLSLGAPVFLNWCTK